MGMYGTVRRCRGLYGVVWAVGDYMGMYGVVWDCMGIWGCRGLYGTVWDCMGA